MSEELLIRRIRAALDVAPADPALRGRVIASLPLDRRQARARYNFWAPALAVALAVAVVLGLVWANPWRSFPAPHPATVPLSECELPVYGFAPYKAGAPNVYDVGFLDLASRTFTPVPISIAAADQTRAVLGNESPSLSYDRLAGAWVPVKSSWVAPDGMSYVYVDGGAIHLRSVRSQADRVLLSNKPVFLIGWSGGSVYYATRDGYASDLWVLDPATGKDRRVLPMQSMTEWWMAGPNAIWGSPYYSGKLARYDTKSHQVSSWSADRLLELIGIDSSGNPIILRGDRGGTLTGEVAVMHGDGRATSLDSTGQLVPAPGTTVIADADRIWISANGQRLWVYSPDTGLLSLDQSSNRSIPNGLVVAGGCVSEKEVRAQSAAAGG
jgi:hypothetical protein